MADLDSRDYSAEYSGLLVTVELSLGVLSVGLLVHEVIRRRRRKTIYWRSNGKVGTETSEEWSFGYLYHCRSFIEGKTSPRLPKWPLQWILQCCWLSEAWYAEHAGLDAAAYIRFLRGAFYYVTLHFFTTFPTILTIHLTHSNPEISSSDIGRASLSSLIVSDDGIRLLFVHVIFLYWLCFTWAYAVYWVGTGHLRLRRAQINKLAEAYADRKLGPQAGWRFRSIVVTNIPADLDLRDEAKLVAYFEDGLRQAPLDEREARPTHRAPSQPRIASSPTLTRGARSDLITKVVLVRKVAELHAHIAERTEALHNLEAAHIQLAKNVMHAVRLHRQQQQRIEAKAEKVDLEKDPVIERLSEVLGPYLDTERFDHDQSIWEVLRTLPRDYLDAYQPLYKLKKLFKNQKVPAIDYWTTKLNLLNALVDDLRSRPDLIAPSSTAFITFEQARDARRACRFMPSHPNRLWACKVRMAPDARDVIWTKLAKVTFKGDLIRSILIQAAIWFVTIVWILPVSLLLAALSLDNIANKVPALARYLDDHKSQKALLSSFVPTLLVTLLSFVVPTLLNQISMRAQNFFTVSKLHSRIMSRYWVWLVCNVVVLFCAGSSAIKAVFTDIAAAFVADTLLKRIAQAFPAGAVFFVGWQLLTLGIQHGFEIMMFGFPWINHASTRKSGSPRKRLENSLPRMINTYWWIPSHSLVLAITNIFALLNPLTLAFGFLYFCVDILVFKNQFAHVYYRRHWEHNGRLYIRFMRWSLDTLMLTEVVMMAFFFVLGFSGYGGACIAVLVVTPTYKLVLTRWFKAHMDALDIHEASIHTGETFDEAHDLIEIPLLPAVFRRMPFSNRLRVRMPSHKLSRPPRTRSRPSPALQPSSTMTPWAREGRDSLASDRQPIMRSNSQRTDGSASSPALGGSSEEGEKVGSLQSSGARTEKDKLPPFEKRRPTALPPLVSPHPHLIRDDRPDYDAAYDDPHLIDPLVHALWLPRDPLSVLDLNDTVDYRGPAIVSSEGGSGRLGQWDEPADPIVEVPTMIAEDVTSTTPQRSTSGPARRPTTSSSLTVPSNTGAIVSTPSSLSSATRLRAGERLQGTERIAVAEEVAARLDEEVDDTPARRAWRSFSQATGGQRSPSSTISSPRRRPRASTVASPGAMSVASPARPPSSHLSVEAATSPPAAGQKRASGESTSYFPPPTRLPSTLRRTPSAALRHPPGTRVVSQAEALREEVLAESRERAAAHQKAEAQRREDERRAEAKAAERDRRRSSVGEAAGRPSWLARTIANLTTP